MSSYTIKPKITFDISHRFLQVHGQLPLASDVVLSNLEGREIDMLHTLLSKNVKLIYNQNSEMFLELLATAIANSASETNMDKLKKTAQGFKDPENVWVKTEIVNGIGNCSSTESEVVSIVPMHVDQK